MNKLAKIAIGALALVGVFYVSAMIYGTFIFDGCKSYALVELPQPNGKYVATLSLSACDHDSYTELDLWLVDKTNRDANRGINLSTNPNSTDFRLTWQNEGALIVDYPATLELDTGNRQLFDVDIKFRPMLVEPNNALQ